MFEFRLNFHWSLFLGVQLAIFQHWFRQWLGAVQATSHYLNQWWLDYRRIYASLGLNELMVDFIHIPSVYFILPVVLHSIIAIQPRQPWVIWVHRSKGWWYYRCKGARRRHLNSSLPGQNGNNFTYDILRCICVNEMFCVLIKISTKFVP